MAHQLFAFILALVIGFGGRALISRLFLRAPARTSPANSSDKFLSPAQGTVAAVRTFDLTLKSNTWEPKADGEGGDGVWLNGLHKVGAKGTIVSITMSPTDTHWQRAPMASTVLDRSYKLGRFNNAMNAVRTENESNAILLRAINGSKYYVVQIAGALARRIEDYVAIGQEVKQGDVIGLIKLGSQVSLILPDNAQVLCNVGDKVIDGETIIAEWV